MFHRGQLCELDFQILDHNQRRRPPKFPIRFTPLPYSRTQLWSAV